MKCRACRMTVLLLALACAGVIYKFAFQGSVMPGADDRSAILPDPGERGLVLSEMRVFLESVRQITNGIAADDLPCVAQQARRPGRAARQAVPGSLPGKLPLACIQRGLDTPTGLDELAPDAEQLGDREHMLSQLGTLLQNCVARHAVYRIDSAAPAAITFLPPASKPASPDA